MTKILGLDLGTNSIGWAIVDDDKKQILDAGVRIFPEGVNNLGEGDNELSKNASRTGDRGTRRQFFRRRLRKRILLKELSLNNMCPLTDSDFEEWKNKKKFPEKQLKNWFSENPYKLRDKALSEKISLEQLGRIFYHFTQRRGFQSNSRSAGKDDGAIYKGNKKEGKIGITETVNSIGEKTLGSYLHNIV
ncbi:MAG: CRISPR-associated protein Csn1, partial [Bacteroidales bacterium]|nr:CRISPR-associated protein Csn1 [Bacteroidales bacterium]